MNGSILGSVKKVLGLSQDYTAFDEDLVMHINSELSNLHQLGIGPIGGLTIQDASAEWSDFIGTDPLLNSVKTLVCLRVKLIFDPPATSFAIQAMEKQIDEFTWRICVQRESTQPSS